jgi:hypothetical protein
MTGKTSGLLGFRIFFFIEGNHARSLSAGFLHMRKTWTMAGFTGIAIGRVSRNRRFGM